MVKILYKFANSTGVVDKYEFIWDFLLASLTLSENETRPIVAHNTPEKPFINSVELHNFTKDRIIHKFLKGLVPVPPAPVAALPQELTNLIQAMADFLTNRDEQE